MAPISVTLSDLECCFLRRWNKLKVDIGWRETKHQKTVDVFFVNTFLAYEP